MIIYRCDTCQKITDYLYSEFIRDSGPTLTIDLCKTCAKQLKKDVEQLIWKYKKIVGQEMYEEK